MANKYNLDTIISSLIKNQQNIAQKLVGGNYKVNGTISASNFILENGTSLKDIKTISGLSIASGNFEKATNKLILNRYNEKDSIQILIDVSGGGSTGDEPKFQAFCTEGGTIDGIIKASDFKLKDNLNISLNNIWNNYSSTSGLHISGATYEDNYLKLKQYNGTEITAKITTGGLAEETDPKFAAVSSKFLISGNYNGENNQFTLTKANDEQINIIISSFNILSANTIISNNHVLSAKSDLSTLIQTSGLLFNTISGVSGLSIANGNFDKTTDYLTLTRYNGDTLDIKIEHGGGGEGDQPLFKAFMASGGIIHDYVSATNFVISNKPYINLSGIYDTLHELSSSISSFVELSAATAKITSCYISDILSANIISANNIISNGHILSAKADLSTLIQVSGNFYTKGQTSSAVEINTALSYKVNNRSINTSLSGNTARDISTSVNANTDYYFGLLSGLTFTNIENSPLQTNVYFTTGDQITVNFPTNTKFIGDIIFDTNKEYIINISNNIVVIGQIN